MFKPLFTLAYLFLRRQVLSAVLWWINNSEPEPDDVSSYYAPFEAVLRRVVSISKTGIQAILVRSLGGKTAAVLGDLLKTPNVMTGSAPAPSSLSPFLLGYFKEASYSDGARSIMNFHLRGSLPPPMEYSQTILRRHIRQTLRSAWDATSVAPSIVCSRYPDIFLFCCIVFSCFYVNSPNIELHRAISHTPFSDACASPTLMLIGLHFPCHTTSSWGSCLALFGWLFDLDVYSPPGSLSYTFVVLSVGRDSLWNAGLRQFAGEVAISSR